jgi:VWFA-related protein
MMKGRLLPLLCLTAISFSVGRGQSSAPRSTTATRGPAAAKPVIRTRASLVLVDVVVTDKKRPVEGVTAARFHIFEDGKEQRITVFEEHRASDAQEQSAAPALGPHEYSNYPRYTLTSAANVLLLDALNTPLTDQMAVRRQMIEYVKKVPTGTRLAVFTLASRLRMIEGFTTDAAAIAAAITGGKGEAQPSVLLERPAEQDEMNGIAESMSSVDGGALQQFLSDTESFQADVRVQTTLDAMQELGRYLAAIPGRKNLIWFSGSFPLGIDPDATLGDAFSGMRQYTEAVKQTDDLLAAARVAVYPVDARGVMGLASVDAERNFSGMQRMSQSNVARGQNGGPNSTERVSNRVQGADARFLQQTTQEHDTMNQIAEETGGEALYNTNGLAGAIEQAIGDGSNYYTLGYVPADPVWDGTFRRIEVRVEGGKDELSYRHGYYADDPLQPGPQTPGVVSPIVAALERGAPPLAQIVFEARVLSAKDPAAQGVKTAPGAAGEVALHPAGTRYLVDFSVDPRGLAWSALANGGAHAEVEVAMVAWDAEGKRVNYTDHALGANLSLGESQQAAKSGLPVHQEIDLPAGACFLRVAVHDLRNGRIGSVEIPVTVPKG